jgi:cation diffusion facilitator CzcD-associated flavoprotein CzcO
MGIKLREAGFEDFRLYEKANEVGGTWRENTYPGLSCDIPARYYSFSFAPNPDWSGVYASGQEIWSYLHGIADRYGLRPHIRFGEEIVSARWQDGRWTLRTAAGEEDVVDVLISACGSLHHPRQLHACKSSAATRFRVLASVALRSLLGRAMRSDCGAK